MESVPRLKRPPFGFNGLSELIYYKNYSRALKFNGYQYGNEVWWQTCKRVIEGVMSIRKDWYNKNKIYWDERYYQDYSKDMFKSMGQMHWLPPGRGLFAMGTDIMFERGAMPLYNCFFKQIGGKTWIKDLSLMMDCLMNGVGAGFEPVRTGLKLTRPRTVMSEAFVIPDSREGWYQSVELLLKSYFNQGPYPHFDYTKIRPEGSIIESFGGIASGPEPLILFHKRAEMLCEMYIEGSIDEVAFLTDLANCVGDCVISGNVRRSAEIALGQANDDVFWNLKDLEQNPYRSEWYWMSNNSIKLQKTKDFLLLQDLAYANMKRRDLGYINLLNFPYGRIGKKDSVRRDSAIGINPCGEIPLMDGEVCNVVETCPTTCPTIKDWLKACEFATFYASTVALLPTHRYEVNKCVVENRRIGVSIMDFTPWVDVEGQTRVVSTLRKGYKRVRQVNKRLAKQAGVPESIRVTTIKPGGTVPKLPARVSGASYPTHRFMIRRIEIGRQEPVFKKLVDAGIPYEQSVYDKSGRTYKFEFPVEMSGAKPATEVSIWKQAMNVVLLQREWADNAVSNTLYFNPETEAKELEGVLSAIAPVTKSVSMTPHTQKGAWPQMPEEGISHEEYQRRVSKINPIDWSGYNGSDGVDERYCDSGTCQI